ncbi:MAG TPA: ABC transporter substrate-binding protein [Candidatus Binatia bacterium]|jgi:iron(III) transport system substrate-binding protein
MRRIEQITLAAAVLALFAATAWCVQEQAISGAKKEGSLVWYTAMQPEDSAKLIELYRSRYPFVDATSFRAGSAPLLNRILTEARANRHLFDVVSGKFSDLMLLQKKNLLGKISSVELNAYPEKFRDAGGRWVDLYNNYYTIAYNTNHLRPADAPAKWDDLLDSKWSDGKITIDPRSYDWYFGMRTLLGTQKAQDYMRKLAANKPAFRDGNVLIANLLAAGEFPLAVTYAHLVERLRTRGAPVDWVAVKPIIAVPISVALPLRSSHPSAAALFVDLVLGKEGAELLKAMGRLPTRSDVTPSAKRLDPRSLDLLPLRVSSDEMEPEEFRALFGIR